MSLRTYRPNRRGFLAVGALTGMGLSDVLAASSLRFSVGRFTTESDVVRAAAVVAAAVGRLRAVAKSAPAWCSGSSF